MKCMIVDDEKMAIEVIKNHISHITGLEVASVFYNAMDAFSALQLQPVDILFLDIQMPKMSGLNLASITAFQAARYPHHCPPRICLGKL